MSTEKFDRIAAIAGESDSRRNIELADGRRTAAHHVSPAVLEFRLQQMTAERDQLAAALQDAVSVCSGHGDGFFAPDLGAAAKRYRALLDRIKPA